MRFIGAPVVIDDTTVIQFTENRYGHHIPYRVAVCKDHPECPVMFFDGDDCGPHFRWATPADIDRLAQKGAAA